MLRRSERAMRRLYTCGESKLTWGSTPAAARVARRPPELAACGESPSCSAMLLFATVLSICDHDAVNCANAQLSQGPV